MSRILIVVLPEAEAEQETLDRIKAQIGPGRTRVTSHWQTDA